MQLFDALGRVVRATTVSAAAQVAARFRRLRPEKMEPLLATLAALSSVRHPPEGYAV